MKKILFIIIIFLCSCASQKQIIKTDTCFIKNVSVDSVYIHDSIFIFNQGDTCFINKWHTKIKEKLVRDTVYISKDESKTVEVPVTPKWVKYILCITGTISLLVLLYFLLKLVKFVIKK